MWIAAIFLALIAALNVWAGVTILKWSEKGKGWRRVSASIIGYATFALSATFLYAAYLTITRL